MTADVDLVAFRHATWGGPDGAEQIIFLGEDLTGAGVAWSFANAAGGMVAFTLSNAAAGLQGVQLTHVSDYVHPVSGKLTGATILVPQIDETTLEGISQINAASEDITLVHTLYVTRAGGFKQAEFAGKFTIRQGAPN